MQVTETSSNGLNGKKGKALALSQYMKSLRMVVVPGAPMLSFSLSLSHFCFSTGFIFSFCWISLCQNDTHFPDVKTEAMMGPTI